jgi:hypothetical protein
MCKELKLSSDGSDCGNKKCKWDYGGVFCQACVYGRNVASVAMKIYPHLI